jgi:hypothetical protein
MEFYIGNNSLNFLYFNVLTVKGGLHLGILFHACCKIYVMMAKKWLKHVADENQMYSVVNVVFALTISTDNE